VSFEIEHSSQSSWIDRRQYPFEPHRLNVDGGRMHYIDEGEGEPIVFLHGLCTWSYMYRTPVRTLSNEFRCVAPDMLGSGLSDKPANWDYKPMSHARNLGTLIEHLDLRDVTLVVHGYGGPIGLDYMLEHMDRFKRLVLMNTWMWDPKPDTPLGKFAKSANGPLGRLMFIQNNQAVKQIRASFADKAKYTESTHCAYSGTYETKDSRIGTYLMSKYISECGPWFEELWKCREKLADMPIQLLWGLKDPIFDENCLNKWWHEFPTVEATTFADSGGYLFEEHPARRLRRFATS